MQKEKYTLGSKVVHEGKVLEIIGIHGQLLWVSHINVTLNQTYIVPVGEVKPYNLVDDLKLFIKTNIAIDPEFLNKHTIGLTFKINSVAKGDFCDREYRRIFATIEGNCIKVYADGNNHFTSYGSTQLVEGKYLTKFEII